MADQLVKPRAQGNPAPDPQPQRAKIYRLQRRLDQAKTLAAARIQRARELRTMRETAYMI